MLIPTLTLLAQAQAQPGPAPDPGSGGGGSAGVDPATGALPTFLELFNYSPIINGVLVGLSILAVLLAIFFLLTINGRAIAPSDFVDEVTKLAMRGKHEAAADLCRAHRRVFVATVIRRFMDNPDADASVMIDMIDTEGRRRADVLWNRVSYLADIANVAPMLGLLGTVLGMIKAFFTAQFQALDATASALTSGIAQAMSTTLFGLAVGILALFLYTVVKGRATRTLADAEAAVHAVADHVIRGGRSDVPRGDVVSSRTQGGGTA